MNNSKEINEIKHDDIFKEIPNPFKAVRYHSLIIDRQSSIMPELIITAETNEKIIMAVQHIRLPIYGVQFHPEVILLILIFLIERMLIFIIFRAYVVNMVLNYVEIF